MIDATLLKELASQHEYHVPQVEPDGALSLVQAYDLKRLSRRLGRVMPSDINTQCQHIVTKATRTGWLTYAQAQRLVLLLAPYTTEELVMNLLRDTKLFPFMNGALLLMVTPTGTTTGTIRDVKLENSAQGDEPIVAVYFNEFPQAVSLNKTRALQLMDEIGFDTDKWRGVKIRLTADKKAQKAFGKKYHPLSLAVVSKPAPQSPQPQAAQPALDIASNGAYEE